MNNTIELDLSAASRTSEYFAISQEYCYTENLSDAELVTFGWEFYERLDEFGGTWVHTDFDFGYTDRVTEYLNRFSS